MAAPVIPQTDRLCSNQEVDFSFDELFFSRTDTRGKISSGNVVFRRISGFSWGEMLGKPHNVIRHPDVPRAVFWLLWDRLKRGLPTGAYVKNRAKDGRFYWVYAIVTPIDGGYLSVRLKPGSALFDIVEQEYAQLLAAEKAGDMTPAQGAEALTARLAELGFPSYDAFMGTTLVAEFVNRSEKCDTAMHPAVSLYSELMSASTRLLEAAQAIVEGYQRYRFVPLNLTVQASRLGDQGRAICAISHNYETLSEQIRLGLDDFLLAAQRVFRTIHEGSFLLATSEIQDEVASVFEREMTDAETDRVVEADHLKSQRLRFRADAMQKVVDVQWEVYVFSLNVSEIKRLAAGLAAIRIMGKVEVQRLEKGMLADLLMDLEAFQDLLRDGLGRILTVNEFVRAGASQLSADAPVAVAG